MFGIGKNWKFQVRVDKDHNVTYTGEIIEETSTHIKVFTIRGETLVLSLDNIEQSIEVNE